MKKRKGKTKRWLAGILSAVLVIGSINLVDALEGSNGESALYDAPELTITQGATDYDLMKDITYDSSMYELAVVNDGGFDVNTVGDYEVTYSLTSKDDGTLEPGDSGDASNSDNENKDQNSGDNQGGDNTQTGDNSDNAGSDNGSDSSDSSNGGDSADAGQGDTGSDSSNAEDSMDAGQGDTNSDSSNAGDSTDAGQGDTNSDSSNAEDTADALNGEDAAQSEENTGDTGVLGVSRPRTGVDMSYQSEPVGAEAVDVTKGDDTNTVDTQENQVITFTRTVHVVAASEDEVPVYEARELVLTQGEEDYDLTDDILYDDVKYTLTVGDLGGFDINKIGSYEVTYSLTPVTTEGTQENGQDDTQENQVITFQRTVTVKAAVEENALYEAPDLYLEWGQEDYDLTEGIIYDKDLYEVKVSDPGDFDIYTLGEYEVTYLLDSIGKSAKGEDTTNSTAEKSSEVKTASQEAIYFTRNVFVEESTVTKAASNGYSLNLGTAIWDADSHTTFKYPHAKIENVADKLTLLTVTVENGSFTKPNDFGEPNLTDVKGTSATWIFSGGKSADELQTCIRNITFTPQTGSNMNVNITIDGNETQGFDNIPSGSKLTQWTNGHYYMIVPQNVSWTDAYNNSKKYVLAGRKGYLVTIRSYPEAQQLANVFNATDIWTAGVRVTKNSSGTKINDEDSISGYFKYNNFLTTNHGYYWTCGPEATKLVEPDVWYSGEPNNTQGIEFFGKMQKTMGFKMNDEHDQSIAFAIEFGGYEDARKKDPGGRDSTKSLESLNKDVTPVDPEATINGIKYPTVTDALNAAQSGDTIKIVKDTVTAVTNGTLKTGVKLVCYDKNTTYTGKQDSKIDVAEDGTVTLKDGKLELSAKASLKVFNPTDGQTYQVTAPDCTSWVTVDKNGDSPYFMGDADGSVKIDAVTYSYENPGQGQFTHVNIPQGMKNNDKVTKAEVAADQQVTIEVDDTNSVVLNGTGGAGNNVIVERRTSDSKVNVKLPSGAQGTIFGHAVGAVPSGGVTVSQSSAENTGYPDRNYIVIAVAGEKVTVDGIEYVATENNQKFYLGRFKATVTIGSNAEITSDKEQTDVGYLKTYTVKISPKADYDLDQDNFIVTMKESDTGIVKNLTFADVCRVDPADGSITVTIPNVSGDITVNAAAKRQMTTLKVTGLVTANAKGSFKAVDASGNEYKLEQDGSINVNRNEELTLIFTPNDFSNPYYSDLTGEKGESFSILTALKETTNNNKDLFTGAKTFNWKEKSYGLKYTPTTSDVTLQAVFTPSHIVHVHVTGGTAEVKDTGLVTKESGADQFQHVIVKDNETVKLELKDTTGTATVYKKAYWSNVDGSGDSDVSDQAFTGNGTSYTYTTKAVGKPQALNITFEEGQTVDVKVTHGTLVTGNDGVAWNDKNSTYQTIVKNNGALKVNIKPEDGYGLKSITVNNVAIDIDAAIKSGELTWDGTTKTYSHTFAKVYQAWNITVDFEKLHEIVFEDQKGNILNKTEHITVIDGDTIPAASFTKMQEEADKSKAENESLFVWVDKTDSTKIYNETTVMTAQTADVVTLIPVYRMNVIKGADGSVIAADDFVIHVNDVRKLTDTEAATLANVTAYDHSGLDISNRVTVEQTKLEELKKKTKGTYVDALTFMIAASGLTTGVEVEVTDDNPTITGKTAHTLTFKGRANETYKYQELDAQGTPTGNVSTILTDGDGKATITGLKKATPYQISHSKYGSVNGKTSLVDAKDIAKQFEDRGAGDTKGNNATDRTEKAENSNVQVIVDDDGNYKVIVKKDIDHTVEIPDTWGEVKIDLGGHTITGDKADDNNAAKPGLDFVKDGSINEHPGTKLEIVNGTIKGGDGSAKHPDGAPGIGASGDTADAGLIIGNDAKVIGGNGANGTEGKDGGNGGAGIDGNGKITPTVNGTVTGGNGGKGGDSATGIPGNGGNGGTGISAGDKTITIHPGGTVKGGDAGSGGSATGGNTNPGGNGGNGGTGTETTQPGKTDNNGGTTSGGNGGDGGNSNNGNGGNGGNGGSGSTGENNNNGGTSSGGNGGNGGDSDKGNGGSGGNGGSSGETGGNGGNNTGGNGGNGGDSNSGNGGSGGNGGDSNSGTGGNGGNGGDSNNGTGGNGGNGGGSNNGTGGNGGNGGNSNNGNGGNGGNGGGSNSGNNGNGGSSGSNGNRPGGNGGGSNNGNGGNGGNNGRDNSGNNSGNNSGDNGGNNGGDNSNTNGNNNSGSIGNTGNTPDAGNTAGNDSGNNAHKGNKGNSTGNSNAGQKDPAEDDSLNDAADESSLTGDADGSDADGSDADGIQEEESIHADSDSVENGTDSDSHIPFGECGFHWIPIVWLLVILGYTVVRVKKLRDESEEA